MSSDNNKQNAGTMTTQDASHIQSAEAKSGTGDNPADSFAARAQSAAAKNENENENENEQDKDNDKDSKGCHIDTPEHAIVAAASPGDEAGKGSEPKKTCGAQ